MASFYIAGAVALVQTQDDLIPPNFPVIDNYTIRYLSENGSDTMDCLVNQSLHCESDQVQPCRSLGHALTGGKGEIKDLILLVYPGSYNYGAVSVVLSFAYNVVIRRIPESDGDVIFRCKQNLEDSFNNFYIANSTNIALERITFAGCGSYSSGIGIFNVTNIVITDCIFRYVELTSYIDEKRA